MSTTRPLFHQKLKPRHRRLGTCHEPSVRGPARIDTKSQRGEPPTPCYVYLLLHKANERFKAGLSQAPKVRAAMLPDATCIALDRSIQVEFASPGRASEVERMLHKALAGFRMQVVGADGQAWDGGTEWFAMPGLRHAINLLRVTPLAGDGFEMAQLQTLEGEPSWHSPPRMDTLAPGAWCRDVALLIDHGWFAATILDGCVVNQVAALEWPIRGDAVPIFRA